MSSIITSIENLSNEFFYEVFDYLNAYDICEAFSNLNYHFYQLLNSSSLLFKIKLDYTTPDELYNNISKKIIFRNKHQIFSLDLSVLPCVNQFFSSFTFNASFYRLESLAIGKIEPEMLFTVLIKLADLPRLFSLNLNPYNTFENLDEVYRLIFNLPKLKYNELILCGDDRSITLPMATNKKSNTIEHLIIDHSCTFKELACIVSYTPRLSRLSFLHVDYDDSNIEVFLPMTLSNLTYISMTVFYLMFDQLKIFIKNINSNLKVLHIRTESEDINYLDANRWEEFILESLPHLKEFQLEYYEHTDYENGFPTHDEKPNQFISSFWITRQWIFEVEIDLEQILYSIRPYKKRWYEYSQHPIINSSRQLSKSARLTFAHVPPDECIEAIILDIDSALTVTDIYHLEMNKKSIFIGTLIHIMESLPKLVSLKIHSLLLPQPRSISSEDVRRFLQISNKNKITKVYLEKIINIEEIDLLIKLYSRMNYFQVNDINNIDVEVFLKDILIKIMNNSNYHLRFLCFRVPIADEKMIEKLKKMITYEKLLVDYSIKRVVDKIYLQWT